MMNKIKSERFELIWLDHKIDQWDAEFIAASLNRTWLPGDMPSSFVRIISVYDIKLYSKPSLANIIYSHFVCNFEILFCFHLRMIKFGLTVFGFHYPGRV